MIIALSVSCSQLFVIALYLPHPSMPGIVLCTLRQSILVIALHITIPSEHVIPFILLLLFRIEQMCVAMTTGDLLFVLGRYQY